ncbi:MAG: zf-HC2 domain-containing protein [Armatimonadetes bacterium]|nr:zf-HC2 domain-containing protein [Armatimonadota bacterium]
MKCRQCRERMSLYLAEALVGNWIEQFEQHIADCPDCAQELSQKQQLLEMLHNLSAPTPSEDLSTRIKAAAQAQLRQPQPQMQPAYYLKVAAACAVVVLAVGIGVVWRVPSVRQALAPTTAPAEMTVVVERQPAVAETAALPVVETALARPEELAEPSTAVASLPHRLRAESATPQPEASSPAPVSSEMSGVEESRTTESVGPGVVKLARVDSAHMMRTAEVRSARPPSYLVQAAARVDSGSGLSLANTDSAQAAQVELAGRTLVGTVVANAVVSQYVREAIIESDKTMLALTTSAPASLIEVTARDAEAEVE